MQNRITDVYAWTEQAPDGAEGVIFAFIPPLGISGTLQHRRKEVAMLFKPIAMQHKTKFPTHTVRFVKLSLSETLETL